MVTTPRFCQFQFRQSMSGFRSEFGKLERRFFVSINGGLSEASATCALNDQYYDRHAVGKQSVSELVLAV